MQKYLFRTVLGVVGILGMMSLGVVNATDVTITYNLSGGYWVEDGSTGAKEVQFTTDANNMVGTTNRKTPSKSGNVCDGMKCMFDGWYLGNGTRWRGYATSDMTVYAKWLPFEDLIVTTGGVTFTIMDRNLGAIVADVTNADSYGYHFQWGNNYGFKRYRNGEYKFPNGEIGIGVKSTDRTQSISTYYKGIWIYENPWNDGAIAKDNLWGGRETSNPDTDRQGPCPYGYHVPDTLEWKAVGSLLKAGDDGYAVRDTLNLPFAGYRAKGQFVYNMGTIGRYWSSTPSDISNAYYLYFTSPSVGIPNDWQSAYSRSHGFAVRCFQNTFPQTLTFVSNGGSTPSTPIQTVRRWETGTPLSSPTRENSIFSGWYTTSGFVEGTKVETNASFSDSPVTLYAKRICNLGYEENETGTGCVIINYDITYIGEDVENLNPTTYTVESEDITLVNPTRTGYTFTGRSGTDIDGITGTVVIPSGSIGDRNYEANREVNQYTITFDTVGGSTIAPITADYGTAINAPSNPTKNGYTFKGWDKTIPSTMPAENLTIKAQRQKNGSSGGGGGGGGGGGSSSSSCKNLPANAVANNNSTPSSNTNYYYSTNTSKVCTFQCKSGYTRNEEKETCDKTSDSQTTSTGTTVKEPEGTGNNTKIETGNNTEIQTGNVTDTSEQIPQNDEQKTEDSPAKTPESKTNSTTASTYSEEFQQAYEFAHENGITTKNTIESADMNGKLTRIAMAKMLSQYAINILGKTPDTSNTKKFDDVSDKRDADYDNGVTLAYQLGIMGQNMANNFRPDDEVTRAEFATALSRMLYNTSDGEYKSTAKYYTNHMKKLKEEGIITKDDPKMKELRGYVMIMLMRSAK